MDPVTDVVLPVAEPPARSRVREQAVPSADGRASTTVVAWLDAPPRRVVPGFDPPWEAFAYVRDVLVAGQRASVYRSA